MNFTLKQLQERVNKLIEQQGENAQCAAWIYTKEDIYIEDSIGELDYIADKYPGLDERVFNEVGNIDYIYQVIQECVDENTEEQLMLQQQEMQRLSDNNYYASERTVHDSPHTRQDRVI